MKYIIYLGMYLVVLTILGCSTAPVSQKLVTDDISMDPSQDPGEIYSKVRSMWTVVLSPVSGDGGGANLSGVQYGGGRGMGGAGFPVMISATLMDDQLIKAGLLYYEKSAEMTSEEAQKYRELYRSKNMLDQYFLIEASLRTSWVKDYLDLGRWTIFIEDETGNKLEPAKIIEQPISSSHMRANTLRADPLKHVAYERTDQKKDIFIYFPRKNLYGRPTLRKDMKELKIVFILEEGGSERAEGSWVFNRKKS